MLDSDLAQVYGVPTTRLNEADRRDVEKDPLYRAKPLGRSTDGRFAADHDSMLYRK